MTEDEHQPPQPPQKPRESWAVRLLARLIIIVIAAGLIGGGYCIGRGISPCGCDSYYQQGVEDGYIDGYFDAKDKYDTSSAPSGYQAYSVRPTYFTVDIDSPFTVASALDIVVSNKGAAGHVYVLKLVNAGEDRVGSNGIIYSPADISWLTTTKESVLVPALGTGLLSAEVKITPLVPSGHYWGALKVYCLDVRSGNSVSIEYQINVYITVSRPSASETI